MRRPPSYYLQRLGWLVGVVLVVVALNFDRTVQPLPSTTSTTTTSVNYQNTSTTTQAQPESESVELVQLVIEFERAFFARYPDDNWAAYLERLTPYASQEFLDQLDPGIFEKEPFLSWREDGSIQAVLEKWNVDLMFDGELTNTEWVDVEVMLDLEQTTSDGVVVLREDVVHQTGWQKTDEGWRVFPVPPR